TQSKQVIPSGAFIISDAFKEKQFKALVSKRLKESNIKNVKGIDAKTPFALRFDAKSNESSFVFYLNTKHGIQTLVLKETEVAEIPVPITCEPLLVVPYLFEANGKGIELGRERPYYKDNVLMVPVVSITHDLLDIKSETDGKFITFATHGNTSITVGENSYFIGRMAAFKLEHAPEEMNGTVYVPLSFFEQVLGYSYEYDENTVVLTAKK
ncbi:MAG: stalk domain-containing protein, partial [Bacilli bacterium]